MYHVQWIALFSANRWRLDVLTFLIKGFEENDERNAIENAGKKNDLELPF